MLTTFIKQAANISTPHFDRRVNVVKSKADDNEVGVVGCYTALKIAERMVCASSTDCSVDNVYGNVLPMLVDHKSQAVVIYGIVIDLAVKSAVGYTVTANYDVDRSTLCVLCDAAFYKLSDFIFHNYFTK